MPQKTWHVTSPDGQDVSFVGPDTMSSDDVITRAKQELAIKSGKIQTTFMGGAAKQLGSDDNTTQALMTGGGILAGLAAPPVGAAMVAGAPLASRFVKYGTEKNTGEQPKPLEGLDLIERGGTGLLSGYGVDKLVKAANAARMATLAKEVPTGLSAAPVETADIAKRAYEMGVARQAAGHAGDATGDWLAAERELQAAAEARTKQWQPGLKGHGILPWAAREGARAADYVGNTYLRPMESAAQALPLMWRNLVKVDQPE